MPGERQVKVGVVPCPPAAWSLRLASKMAWYSGVSGACCPRPGGLEGSNRVPLKPGGPKRTNGPFKSGPEGPYRTHWPFKSGYFPKSTIWAPAVGPHSAARIAIAPSKLLSCMAVLPEIDSFTRKAKAVQPKKAISGDACRRHACCASGRTQD